MVLPPGFSEWEHLQSKVMQLHNKAVQAWFKNQADNDISTPKASLKQACLIKDDDTATMVQLRLWLFEFNCGHTRSLQRPVYGSPILEVQEEVAFKPQVQLYFSQDWSAVPDDLKPVEAEVKFRLFGETGNTMTRAKAEALALKIKNEFALSNGYQFDKGKNIVYYRDKQYGYDLRIFAISKAEGEAVIKKVLSIQNHPFVDRNLVFSSPERNSLNIPVQTEKIYGRNRKERRWRPTCKVRFRWASLKIYGVDEDIVLVDTTNYYRSAIQQVGATSTAI